jgi:xanthine dehydrogenase accessory factor
MEIFSKVLKWLDEGKKAAIATVIQKQGSALRGVGSKMGISSDMEMVGSVSGGCVEGAVVQEALKVMNSNQSAIVDYGISDDTAWSVGLACGGQIKILIEPINQEGNNGLTRELIEKLIILIKSDKSFCMLTEISGRDIGTSAITSDGNLIYPKKEPHWLEKVLIKELNVLEKTETSGIIKTNQNEIFAYFSYPKPRLVIIGAVHIAQSLIKMAHICGFSTIIIDPRRAFTKIERFQGVDQMIIEWPTDGLESIELKDRDYLVTLSHDDKLDLPALQKALDKKVRYIGMLSSRKTRDGRFEQLKHEGFSSDELKRIYAPVGLDLGARSPEEIALSILAEITAFRYGKVKEI